MKTNRRKIIKWIIIIILLWLLRPIFFLSYVYLTDSSIKEETTRKGFTIDASGLNETKIDSLININDDPAKALIQLQSLIKYASKEHKKISIAGSQHSMGGHTISQNGIVINMKPFCKMTLDTFNNTLTVGAGAVWADIIPYLNKYRRSVKVMQSNNSFTVGGSVSVNCHGWQPSSGPIASTVISFKCITADGEIHTCSKDSDEELFRLMLGGYGLFGIITEVTFKVTMNEKYKLTQQSFSSNEYPEKFTAAEKKGNAGLLYGRLCIASDNFLNEAILSVFEKTNLKPDSALQKPGLEKLERIIFRGSVNSDYGKNLRWRIEKFSTKLSKGKLFNRNDIMNEGVEVFQNNSQQYTDILHEYFIPRENFNLFIDELKRIMPRYKVDLLNITIRDVRKDTTAYMFYSATNVFGFVMLFNQKKDEAAEKEMEQLTQELIDAVIKLKGTYYLPYRLHATKQQFYTAYPQAAEFFQLKKKYDTDEIFSNYFYEKYK
jgi:FAD/FMN-containing dehydrogenase